MVESDTDHSERPHVPTISRRRFAALLLTAVAIAGACSDDDDEPATGDTTTTSAASPETTTAGAKTIEVTGVDYKFEGLPTEIAAGSKIEFTNKSTKELHELVAVRIPDSETRSVADLVKLPEAETDAIFKDSEPATVLIGPPSGGDVIQALGDGTVTKPGRYAVVCFIPTGVDPAAYLAAAQSGSEGPPDLGGGPPHAANGMFAEVKVT